MKNATEIVLVVDESGSMAHLKNDTISSLNSFIADQAKLPGECNLTIRTFSSGQRRVIREGAVRDLHPIDLHNYQPGGGTPLLDAIGEAIDALGLKLKARVESERPDKVIFVIITDGEENDSRKFTKPRIKEMITTQQNVYKWAFSFLGAGIDAFADAHQLGFMFANTAQYQNTQKGYNVMMASIGDKIIQTRQSGNIGHMAFTGDEQADIKNEQAIKGSK